MMYREAAKEVGWKPSLSAHSGSSVSSWRCAQSDVDILCLLWLSLLATCPTAKRTPRPWGESADDHRQGRDDVERVRQGAREAEAVSELGRSHQDRQVAAAAQGDRMTKDRLRLVAPDVAPHDGHGLAASRPVLLEQGQVDQAGMCRRDRGHAGWRHSCSRWCVRSVWNAASLTGRHRSWCATRIASSTSTRASSGRW